MKITRTFEEAKLAYPIGRIFGVGSKKVPSCSHDSLENMYNFIKTNIAYSYCFIEGNKIRFDIDFN